MDDLLEKCKQLLGCDEARISKPRNKMFLIVRNWKNTEDDMGSYWINEKEERIDFKYLEEKVVASGNTEEELLESVYEYKRFCDMSSLGRLCPRCGRVYGPWTQMCCFCGPRTYDATSTQPYEGESSTPDYVGSEYPYSLTSQGG